MSAPTLTDGVVVLRPLRIPDADDVTECCQDPDTQRFTRIPVPYSRDDAVTWLTSSSPPALDPRTNPTWAITVPGVTGDRWGGSINLELASVQWFAHVGNTASRRVAEKVGFHIHPESRTAVIVRGRGEQIDYWSGLLTAEQLRPTD